MVWLGNIKDYFDNGAIETEFNQIQKNMLNDNNPNWEQLHYVPFESMKKLKALGFMRLAYILDTMQKSVSPDKVENKS